jgi:hypothetical protein
VILFRQTGSIIKTKITPEVLDAVEEIVENEDVCSGMVS